MASSGPCVALINGEHCPLAEARVSVLDRGFLFADSVYEVIPVYDGRLFQLQAHLRRLQNSLDGIRLNNPHTDETWSELLNALVRANGSGDLALYLQVTRGAPDKREHRFPQDCRPTVVAFCQPRRNPSDAELEAGVSAIVREDDRWNRCDIKSTSLLPNVLASDEALTAGANEALLCRGDEVVEGASSNLFAVFGDTVVTPPLDHRVLPGITRDWVIGLAAQHAQPVTQRPVSRTELRQASELWLSSSTRELFPVTRLDDEPVGSGRAGTVWHQYRGWIQAALQSAS